MQEDNPPRNGLAFNRISVGLLALLSDGRLLPTLNDSEIYCARVERFSFAPLHGGLKKWKQSSFGSDLSDSYASAHCKRPHKSYVCM